MKILADVRVAQSNPALLYVNLDEDRGDGGPLEDRGYLLISAVELEGLATIVAMLASCGLLGEFEVEWRGRVVTPAELPPVYKRAIKFATQMIGAGK